MMKKNMLTKLITILSLLAYMFISNPLYANDDSKANIISKIVIKNNQRVEPATILSYLDLKNGEAYKENKANNSIKNLYTTGLFADVKISQTGSEVTIYVEENPLVNKISFEGNKRISTETLTPELSLKSRAVYSKAKLQADVERIQSLYQKSGRFGAIVVPKIIKLDQNRINIVFEVKEGSKTVVKTIRFIGNNFFSETDLRESISTKETRWYRFFSSSDAYDQDRVSYDKELLKKHYLSNGFANFKVVSAIAEITKDKKFFILTFSLEEGNRYKFGKINVESKLPNIKNDSFKKELKTIPGETFNVTYVNDSIEAITNKLNDTGYAFVEVRPNYKDNEKDKTMDITYKIKEGPKVYIDKINITGNVRTLDKVIRREFRLAEGDPYNSAKLKRSKDRINNLDFFEKVDIRTDPGSDSDKTDINVNVKEKSTGELNFGAGFSTTEGPLGNVSLRERNLLGRGQDLKLAYQKSSITSETSLGFTEPSFMDKELAAGFDIFNITRDQLDESSFNSDTKGVTLKANYNMSEYLEHSIYYTIQGTKVSNVPDTASIYIKRQEGSFTNSIVGHTFIYDKRDSQVDPKEGYVFQVNQEGAGLGGDTDYIKHEAKFSYYVPVYKRSVILLSRLKGGDISGFGGQDVRINDRFFIGSSIIRGFDNAGIGPRDLATLDALGGNDYYFGSTELTFPLGLPEELDFRGSIFLDAASLFNSGETGPTVVDTNALRATTGVGVAWSSPLGPIRLDLSFPIKKENYDKTQKFQFNFGTRF